MFVRSSFGFRLDTECIRGGRGHEGGRKYTTAVCRLAPLRNFSHLKPSKATFTLRLGSLTTYKEDVPTKVSLINDVTFSYYTPQAIGLRLILLVSSSNVSAVNEKMVSCQNGYFHALTLTF